MNSIKTINDQAHYHNNRLMKLGTLLEKANAAILGEEPQMRAELMKIRNNTIEAMKEHQICLEELKLLKEKEFSNA